MGAWGVKIYQDDVACDVKLEYVNKLKAGIDNIEITEAMMEDYMGDDDEPTFWFALADTQWKYGRLLEEVKENAIKFIDSGEDLERWKEDPKLYEKRKKVLLELKEKLNLPQPPKKKVSKLCSVYSPFKIGDLLLYQIKDDTLKNHKWYQKYVLFQVIGINVTYFSGLPKEKFFDESPVISLYNFVGNEEDVSKCMSRLNFISSYLAEEDDRFAVLCFNKRDFKKANFKVLMNNKSSIKFDVKKKYPRGIGMNVAMLNIYNFESYLVIDLERNEKNLVQM